jgi:hypothetical protein
MSDSGSRSSDDVIAALRSAAAALHDAIRRAGTASADEQAAAARLKEDVSRLEQSATELVAKLSGSLEQQRTEVESSFDREHAERTAGQLRSSLEELAALASALAASVAAAAGSSIQQAEPELKAAQRSLEDVVGSAAVWVRAAVDPARDQRGNLSREGRPPLDEL